MKVSDPGSDPSRGVAPRSFRDPSGLLFREEGRVLRALTAEGMAELSAFLGTPLARESLAAGRLVGTEVLGEVEAEAILGELRGRADGRELCAVVEHEVIPFPSYPQEWTTHMLHAAGALTLELAEAALAVGMGLKDATPMNVLFRGPEPVFVDVSSFESRHPGDATWRPYAQFVRSFLLPLALEKHFGIPLRQSYAGRREGPDPAEVYAICGPLRRLRPPFLSLVTLPTWLSAGKEAEAGLYRPRLDANPERARFVLRGILGGLRRKLDALAPPRAATSHWSGYLERDHDAAYIAQRERFVERVLDRVCPARVLDVGANTGHYSALAARRGARVVAVDSDPVAVGHVWERARREGLPILPLVLDFADPTPPSGWRNQERSGFLERARGRFDLVLMLAVIHHMIVTEGIPVGEVIRLAAELTTGTAVIEFVDPSDPLFQRLVRGREALYRDLTRARFEDALAPFFHVVEVEKAEGAQRWLYALERRSGRDS